MRGSFLHTARKEPCHNSLQGHKHTHTFGAACTGCRPSLTIACRSGPVVGRGATTATHFAFGPHVMSAMSRCRCTQGMRSCVREGVGSMHSVWLCAWWS